MKQKTIILISNTNADSQAVTNELKKEFGLKEVSLNDLRNNDFSEHAVCQCSGIVDLDELNLLGYAVHLNSDFYADPHDPHDAACRIFDEACDFFFQEIIETGILASA